MTKLELIVLRWTPVRILTGASKKVVLPGFEGLSLYEVGRFFLKEIRNTKLNERSAAVTYNFLMAIPPTLLFLFTLIPYLPLRDVQQTILNTIRLVAPNPEIYNSISSFVVDFMNTERGDVLSFGILLTLFFSSNGMMGLMRTFDRGLPVYVKRTAFRRRWTAIKLTVMLICVAIISLAASIIQTEAVNGLLLRIFNNVIVIKLLSFMILVTLIFSMISIIYTYGPSLTHRFKFVSPGSVFATILSVLTTIIFFFLVNNILNYNKVYGSIGTLIAFMVWVYLNTMVILLGYELNISILLGKTSGAHETKKQTS